MLREPNSRIQLEADERGSAFVIDTCEPVSSETIEYTEGQSSSPYFIPSSICD
jgi:hypothetical protein